MSVCTKLGLILWKNWLFRRRHYVVTAFELILPTLFATMLYMLKNKGGDFFTVVYINESTSTPSKDIMSHEKDYSPNPETFKQNEPNNFSLSGDISYFFLYTPETQKARDIIQYLPAVIQNIYPLNFKIFGVKDEATMERLATKGVRNVDAGARAIGGVSFIGLSDSTSNSLHYRIRLPANSADWQTEVLSSPINLPGPSTRANPYLYQRFLRYQHAIAIRFIEMQSKKENLLISTNFEATEFPYPPYHSDKGFSNIMTIILPLFITLSYLFTAPIIIKRIVREKEIGIRELMKMMGLPNWIQWTGWFISSFIMMGISAIIIVALLCAGSTDKPAVLPKSAPELLYIIMLLYITSAICFCFYISSFFSKPTIATAAGVLIWLITFLVPYYTLLIKYHRLTLNSKMALALLPNMAIAWAIRIVAGLEGKNEGIQWSNLCKPSVVGDDLTMSHVMLIMLVDIILYSTLTWYFDHVMPGAYGVPKPWYFIFTKTYWVNTPIKDDLTVKENENNDKFESNPVGLTPIIMIKNLTKGYSWSGQKDKRAVDNLNLNIYEGQITALLGHNGAGKTTTMSMLTGMFPPTSGTALINNYDIRTQMDSARKELGLCPQHNMLFDSLTVKEHLIFFGRLKVSSKKVLKNDINLLMNKLQLWDKRNDLAKNLSGGMKRKLNLGIALVGGSKIVMLDEPTSGMDPEARRAIWDLLQEYRVGRCILLSTHFMEEADVLGDRIAIMARGQLECCGTPIFLKKRFGAGYHLTINVNEDCEAIQISSVIRLFVATSYLESNSKGELSFILPPDESQHFSSLFEHLETEMKSLGIKNFGLSVTTMEEVFLKVGETVDAQEETNVENSNNHSEILIGPTGIPKVIKRNNGLKLYFQQILGLLLKRFYYARRRLILLIAQIIIPVIIMACIMLLLNKIESEDSSVDPLLKMDITRRYISPVAFTHYTSTEKNTVDLGQSYKSVFPHNIHVETVNNSEQYLIDIGKTKFLQYRDHLVTGADFILQDSSQISVNIWYNGLYYHSLPLGLNLVHNAMSKLYTGDEKSSITVENFPLPSHNNHHPGNRDGMTIVKSIVFGMLCPVALSVLSSSFIIFPIHERTTKCKHLQFMTGLGGFSFWGATFIWDFLAHCISSCIIVIVFAAMDKTNTFVGEDKPGITFLILIAYGWCALPFTYLVSFLFRVPSSGFTFLTIVNLIAGIIMSIWIYLEEIFFNEETAARWICFLLPNFGATFAFMKLIYVTAQNGACDKMGADYLKTICPAVLTGGYVSPEEMMCCAKEVCGEDCFKKIAITQWKLPGIGKDLMMLSLDGVIFIALLLLFESSIFFRMANFVYTRLFARMRKGVGVDLLPLDGDVQAERERIRQLINRNDQSTDLFVVQNLAKYFWSLTAVDHLNFGVANGTCFGLLGINGAGKTTTFQMLTGDLLVTTGNAFVKGISLTENRSKYLYNIGYCPQFDALLDHLTGKELLTVFAHLNGISGTEIKNTIDSYLSKFDLLPHADKITLNYSGGNKRKLSTALAFIGQTAVVFLDEPTTGVDPMAKRKIWGSIQDANNSGTSIILTSHSMEECEVLCNRVAIMVNGQFQCLGGIQYLKNKFSQGFTILAKMKRNSTDQVEQENKQKELQNFIETQFPSASLKDVHQGLIHYQVNDTNTKWNYLFATMEEIKVRFDLEDYSVSQATLEQIFLSFARKQRVVAN